MDNGFQFFDIILFGMIAVFLILRLRSVLGRRDGHEGGFTDIFNRSAENDKAENGAQGKNDNNIIPLPGHEDDSLEDVLQEPETPLEKGIREINSVDAAFAPGEFVSGARIAFEMILGSYASGDTDTLKPLLSAEVYSNFERSIREREEEGQTMEETLVSIRAAEVIEAYLEGTIANVTVKFVSDQVHALFDKEGTLVEGDPNHIIQVTDFWTFARNTRSRDPNWSLVATRSLD